MANPYWWQMAHYALGKLELELGYRLTWRERSKFIKDFIEENDTEYGAVVEHIKEHGECE